MLQRRQGSNMQRHESKSCVSTNSTTSQSNIACSELSSATRNMYNCVDVRTEIRILPHKMKLSLTSFIHPRNISFIIRRDNWKKYGFERGNITDWVVHGEWTETQSGGDLILMAVIYIQGNRVKTTLFCHWNRQSFFFS